MSRDLEVLVPKFRVKVQQLQAACAARGVIMRCFFTVRTPHEQAKLWRQSRPSEYIDKKINMLLNEGAPFLASVLQAVGPCNGPNVTGALPGESWHQYGEAADHFWLVDGKAIWDSETQRACGGDLVNGYHVYHEEAEKLGLTTVTYDKGRRDWPHVQGPSAGSPRATMTWADIDAEMREQYG